MENENTAGAENSNNAPTTAPESGTAPEGSASSADKQGSVNTLLTDGNNTNQTETGSEAKHKEAKLAEPGSDNGGDGEKKPEETVVPEKYEFTDVGDTRIDSEVKDAFSDVARELGLSQEKAQGVLDKMAPAIEKSNQAQLAALSVQWAEQSKSDKEFGGEKFNENMAFAKRALDEFGSPELMEILNKAGLGNHPEIIRIFYRAGKAISGDQVHLGRGASDGKSTGDKFGDIANRMYE